MFTGTSVASSHELESAVPMTVRFPVPQSRTGFDEVVHSINGTIATKSGETVQVTIQPTTAIRSGGHAYRLNGTNGGSRQAPMSPSACFGLRGGKPQSRFGGMNGRRAKGPLLVYRDASSVATLVVVRPHSSRP
ncbi:MAG: hypothetical protein GF344_10415 [Chitinivibrionales bacterium]|nr:hypothetical protein [Chitinivibrionales bacterium]MBD3357238.1 hypothetical protein [Chitinivibrionales bacterium]